MTLRVKQGLRARRGGVLRPGYKGREERKTICYYVKQRPLATPACPPGHSKGQSQWERSLPTPTPHQGARPSLPGCLCLAGRRRSPAHTGSPVPCLWPHCPQLPPACPPLSTEAVQLPNEPPSASPDPTRTPGGKGWALMPCTAVFHHTPCVPSQIHNYARLPFRALV